MAASKENRHRYSILLVKLQNHFHNSIPRFRRPLVFSVMTGEPLRVEKFKKNGESRRVKLSDCRKYEKENKEKFPIRTGEPRGSNAPSKAMSNCLILGFETETTTGLELVFLFHLLLSRH